MSEDNKPVPHSTDPDEIRRREAAAIPHDEADNIHLLEHHTVLPHTRLSDGLDRFIRGIGSLVSWGWLLLIGVIVLNVTMRYLFGQGRIELEEIQWHIYAVGFLVGMSYVIECDDHVRVDLLHARFSLKTQAWVELAGMLFFLLPFVGLVLYFSIPFIANSYAIGEVSQAPGGLPYRWAIRAMLFIGFALMVVAIFSRLLRVSALLFGYPLPIADSTNQGAK